MIIKNTSHLLRHVLHFARTHLVSRSGSMWLMLLGRYRRLSFQEPNPRLFWTCSARGDESFPLNTETTKHEQHFWGTTAFSVVMETVMNRCLDCKTSDLKGCRGKCSGCSRHEFVSYAQVSCACRPTLPLPFFSFFRLIFVQQLWNINMWSVKEQG